MSVYTILVPFDFSSNSILALEKACELVPPMQAELHMLYVKEGAADVDSQRHSMNRLLTALPPTFELQHNVHREVLNGTIHEEIIEYAKKCNANLIVMGSRGRSGVQLLTHGSVAQRVTHDSPCPVVLVKPNMLDQTPILDEVDSTYVSLKETDSPALDLLARAISLRATDVHIDPQTSELYGVRFRIDGSLVTYCTVDSGVAAHLMHQYLNLAKLDISEPFRPREGRLMLPSSMRDFEARLTATPVSGGGAMSLRLFSKDNVFLPLEGLGFSGAGLETVRSMLRGSEGLVLVTGPTGSGKTTTVYSMLQTFGNRNRNIVSIEDPVEFDVPFVRQMNVDERHDVSMTSGLRTLLRMDPDIIFVGEIRDPENAEIALRAASSGRFVFSSLHTRDVASTLTAFRDMGVTNHSISGNLIGVVNQRLVRKLCEKCRKPGEFNEQDKDLFRAHGIEVPAVVLEPVGCVECRNTGFKGRCGIFECLKIDDGIKNAIAENATEAELRQLIRTQGIASLTAEALGKVREGITSFSEAVSVRWIPC